MSAAPKSHRLLTVEIRFEQDVVLARQRARQLAAALGFDSQLQTRVTTALSEVARNAFQYAGGGRVEFSVLTEPYPAGTNRRRQSLVIEVRDNGPGIANLHEILAGKYRSASGLGIGIIGTQRLMDRVEITSSSKGTAITLAKTLPVTMAPRTAQQLQAIVDDLLQRPAAGPLEEIQVQNQELLKAMEEARSQREDLARVNQELAATNTGVLALYDELETLHRIGLILASKLELRPLIQSIIDVTTTLTDAEVGAFFFREEEDEDWRLYATSGPKSNALAQLAATSGDDFFGADFASGGLIHIPDFTLDQEPCSCSKLATAITPGFSVRSCLTVPVMESSQKLIGALVFASETPRAFSERSERILTSIATQAAVGIEKARLFQSVTLANDAKDQFFAMLSHELRTPLNPAMMIISSLHGDQRVPADLRDDVAIVWRNIRLEARLIDDLLDFNRLIKGKLHLTTEPLDMRAIVQSVVEICREDFEAKGHRLASEFRSLRSTVKGDPARLQQVLWNVLKNAIKFTPSGGSISICAIDAGEMLRIAITDSGHGIEADAVDRIFSAFDQGRTHLAAQFGGLGLGLSIARMFVELHHGKIFAFSRGRDQGTTVTVELPLCEVVVPAPASAAQVSTEAERAITGRILLVDDHPDTLHALTRLLKRRGFETTAVGTGKAAVAAAGAAPFDLFISDLGLPDCSGIDLLAQVREVQNFPAIALSGYGMESDLEQSRNAGFQMHITKPVDFGQLMSTITELLAKVATGS